MSIGASAFVGRDNLKYIEADAASNWYKSVAVRLYSKNMTTVEKQIYGTMWYTHFRKTFKQSEITHPQHEEIFLTSQLETRRQKLATTLFSCVQG